MNIEVKFSKTTGKHDEVLTVVLLERLLAPRAVDNESTRTYKFKRCTPFMKGFPKGFRDVKDVLAQLPREERRLLRKLGQQPSW